VLVAIGCSLAASALWLAIGLADPATLVRVADALTSDGRATRVHGAARSAIQARALQAGAAFLVLALLLAIGRWRGTGAGSAWQSESACAIRGVRRRIARFVREEPGHALALAGFVVLGGSLAGAGVGQPIRCDEATTWLNVVSRSWPTVLLSYQTNNHVLYSALAKLACALGPAPVCLRMPALVAGVLAVPASYVAMRVHFGRHVGVLVAGALSTSLLLLDHATNGRSYSLLTLVFALLLIVAPRLLATRSGVPWLAAILLASVGLWANPVMLYPLAIGAAWLGVQALVALRGAERRAFAGRAVTAAAAVVALVLAWYSPAYVATGFASARAVVEKNALDAIVGEEGGAAGSAALAVARLAVVWEDWTHGRPAAVAWLLLAGAVAGLLVGTTRRACREWSAAIAAGAGAVLWASGALPPTWIFVFLLPLALGLCFAGLWAAVEAVGRPRAPAARGALAVAGAVVLSLSGVGPARSPQAGEGVPWYIGYPDAGEAAAYLRDVLRPGDRIEAAAVVAPPLVFHLVALGACAREEPWSCRLADGETPPRVYFVDAGSDASRRELEALRARMGKEPELARELPASRILRFDRG